MKKPFKIRMVVRDYECDIQGIVNNAVYQNYLEHARHEFIKNIGLELSKLESLGIRLTLASAKLDYRSPLVAGDKFEVEVRVFHPSPIRYLFEQQIGVDAKRTVLSAQMTVVTINASGRPCKAPLFAQAIEPFLWTEQDMD